MYTSRTMTQLATAALQYMGLEGATTRYPTTLTYQWINRSYERYRELITRNGHNSLLANKSANTVADTATVAIGTDVTDIHAVHITVGTRKIPLRPYEHDEREEYSGSTGQPVAWRLETVDGSNAESIRLIPTPNDAYALTIVYIPPYADKTNDADALEFVQNGAEWLTLDVAKKLALAEQDSEMMGLIAREQATLERDMVFRASRRNRTGPARVTRSNPLRRA